MQSGTDRSIISMLYSIYDAKTMTYGFPFPAINQGDALRKFADLVNDPKSMVNRYPEDFYLYELAAYDQVTAVFASHKHPQEVARATVYKLDMSPHDLQQESKRLAENLRQNRGPEQLQMS